MSSREVPLEPLKMFVANFGQVLLKEGLQVSSQRRKVLHFNAGAMLALQLFGIRELAGLVAQGLLR